MDKLLLFAIFFLAVMSGISELLSSAAYYKAPAYELFETKEGRLLRLSVHNGEIHRCVPTDELLGTDYNCAK